MVAPSAAQSHLRFPLTQILGSVGNVRALRALAVGQTPMSASDLARQTGLTPQGMRLVLDALSVQQVVTKLGSGRARLYALNRAHPLARPLTDLYASEQALWDDFLRALRAAIANADGGVRAAWLYGSVARGEDQSRSDVDVAVWIDAPEDAESLRERLLAIEDRFQVRLSVAALTAGELAALPVDDRWWAEVTRDARVLTGAAPAAARRQAERQVTGAEAK